MSTYRDPADIKMENGRAMSDYMRGGPAGLKGVVVARATPGGTPVNYNPHDMSKTVINVVDQSGTSVRNFSLDQITEDRVRDALAAAADAVPGDDIESIRERAAMAFEEMAKMSDTRLRRVPASSNKAPPPVEDTPEEEFVPEHISSSPPVEKVDRAYSPMAAFGLKKKSGITPPVGAATSAKSGPPKKLVYFEKEGIGTVPAFFHDVLVAVEPEEPGNEEETGFMVLIYDLRFEQNAARWFPPSNDPYGRPWAVKIDNDDRLYLVHTTGFQYVYDSREYCILTVVRAVVAVGE